MTKDQKYDISSKEDHQKDLTVFVQCLIRQFGEGEITLTEMWVMIDEEMSEFQGQQQSIRLESMNIPAMS